MGWPRASCVHRRQQPCVPTLVRVGRSCERTADLWGPRSGGGGAHRAGRSGLLVEGSLETLVGPGRRRRWRSGPAALPALGGHGDADAFAPGVVAALVAADACGQLVDEERA